MWKFWGLDDAVFRIKFLEFVFGIDHWGEAEGMVFIGKRRRKAIFLGLLNQYGRDTLYRRTTKCHGLAVNY